MSAKHLIDEHYTCIWANDYYYELIHYSKPEYEALFQNHCDKYFYNNPEGWKLLTEKINSALEKKEKRVHNLSAHDLSGWRKILGQAAVGIYR